jgi:transcriptional regulator with XRE-family HTH domain
MKQELTHIGRRIKTARENIGITMAELAKRANVSEQHIGLLERGRSGVSVVTLVKIAQGLNISTDSLLMSNAKPEDREHTAKDALYFLLHDFSDNEIQFLLSFVRLYREKHNR